MWLHANVSQMREVLTEHATIPWILAAPPSDSALGTVVTRAEPWSAAVDPQMWPSLDLALKATCCPLLLLLFAQN